MATFGKTDIGGTNTGLVASNPREVLFTSNAETGDITAIKAYLRGDAGTVNVGAAIYSDSAGSANTRLAVDSGNDSISTTPGWVTIPIVFSIAASTVYHLVIWADGDAWFYYDAGSVGQSTVDTGLTFENWPTSGNWAEDVSHDREYSLYAVYTPPAIVAGASPMIFSGGVVIG